MAKNKIAIHNPQKIAEKLITINGEILAYEEPLKGLKAKREELRLVMLEALKANKMGGLKTDDGITFSRAYRTTYKVEDLKMAQPWLVEHDCLKPDTTKMGKLLKGTGDAIPAGIGFTETEYLASAGISGMFE